MIDDKQYYNIIEDAAVKYREAYDILMDYWDLLPEEALQEIHKELAKIGL